jgi:CopG-like RHH_1 or ribbon-helix-helix domain, RHH_5
MSTTQPRIKTLRVRVTVDELEQLQRLANAEERTVSQLVWLMVKAGLRAKGTQT